MHSNEYITTVKHSIRPAMETDAPDLLKMIRELAAFENLQDQLTITADSLLQALFGERPMAAAIIAEECGIPVGYAVYFFTYSTFAGKPSLFLEDVYVRPGWRRLGIGTEFLTQLAGIAAGHSCSRFEWMALRWNVDALRFYRSLGAKPLNEWVTLRLSETDLQHLAAGHKEVVHD
jgi:GNAT superfamily N-acetyltransferase